MNIMDDLLNLAKDAAIAGGLEILKVINNFEICMKSDNTPLTTADLRSNDAIIKILSTSGIDICSEERILDNKDTNLYWLIDPLDGTKNFVEKISEFCICIALIKDKTPIIGVIYDPIRDEIFYSKKDDLVYKNNSIIKTNLKSSNFILGRNTIPGPIIKSLSPIFNSRVLFCGSALKFKYLMYGNAGIFIRRGKSSIWDIAAADLMLRNLGGMIIDFKTNSPIKYDLKQTKNNDFVALNSINLDKYKKIVSEYKKNFK